MSKKQLTQVFIKLNNMDQASVLSFAEFLLNKEKNASKATDQAKVIESPIAIDRPAKENVVAAIKRLTAIYPMIKKSGVLSQATQLMTDHLMHGKKAEIAIDELELLFSEHYKLYKENLLKD